MRPDKTGPSGYNRPADNPGTAGSIDSGLHRHVVLRLHLGDLHGAVSCRLRQLPAPPRRGLEVISLELTGTMIRRVFGEDTPPCSVGDRKPAILREVLEDLRHFSRVRSQQDFTDRLEYRLDTRPAVRDQGRAAGGGFEQPNARRKPELPH